MTLPVVLRTARPKARQIWVVAVKEEFICGGAHHSSHICLLTKCRAAVRKRARCARCARKESDPGL